MGVSLSPARVPEVDPIDAAAHLQLLGESLSLIGHRLQETEASICQKRPELIREGQASLSGDILVKFDGKTA